MASDTSRLHPLGCKVLLSFLLPDTISLTHYGIISIFFEPSFFICSVTVIITSFILKIELITVDIISYHIVAAVLFQNLLLLCCFHPLIEFTYIPFEVYFFEMDESHSLIWKIVHTVVVFPYPCNVVLVTCDQLW